MADIINAKVTGQQALAQPYWRRSLTAFDVMVNVWTGGAPDDTISSRMQRWKTDDVPKPNQAKRTVGKFMCGWLGWLQRNHDLKANAGDLARAEAEETRTTRTLEKSGIKGDEL